VDENLIIDAVVALVLAGVGVLVVSSQKGPPSRAPRGIIAVTGHDQPFQAATFASPLVDALMVRTFWSTTEPNRGGFDFSFIDGQLALARANGKGMVISVMSGVFTPTWALAGVQTAPFVAPYGFLQGQTVTLPLPWDLIYLQTWLGFVAVLGQRYGADPNVVLVPMTGPTSVSDEMSLPDSPSNPDEIAQWAQLGYTPSLYEGAWGQTVTAYASAFPTTAIGLATYPSLPLPTPSDSQATRAAVVANAVGANPGRVAIQTSGMSGAKTGRDGGGYAIVAQYAGHTPAGFQLATSCTRNPLNMGGTDPLSAMQATVAYALMAGPINFLEIYEDDLLNPVLAGPIATARARLVM
jgi:hypothetical protein